MKYLILEVILLSVFISCMSVNEHKRLMEGKDLTIQGQRSWNEALKKENQQLKQKNDELEEEIKPYKGLSAAEAKLKQLALEKAAMEQEEQPFLMVKSMSVNSKMANTMERERLPFQVGKSTSVNSKTAITMEQEL